MSWQEAGVGKKKGVFLPQYGYSLRKKDYQWNVNDEKKRWEETQPSWQRGHTRI